MTDPGRVDAAEQTAAALAALEVVEPVIQSGDVDQVAAMLAAGEAALGRLAGGLGAARMASPMSIESMARAEASRARYSRQLQRRVAEGVKGATDG